MPANTVNTIRPAGEVVSAQGSPSERRPAPASLSCSAISRRSRVERARRSSRATTTTSPSHVVGQAGELGPVALRARDLLFIDPLAPGLLQGRALHREVLVVGRDAGIANEHGRGPARGRREASQNLSQISGF